MPISNFVPATRAKFNSRTCNSMMDPPSSNRDNEFAELLWENGQIVMQGQSSRPKKTLFSNAFTNHTKVFEKDNRNAIAPRVSQFGTVEPVDGIGQIESDAVEDEIVPWLNYPIDDYCLELMSEIPEGNTNPLPAQDTSMPSDKSADGYRHVTENSLNLDQPVWPRAPSTSSHLSRLRNGQFSQMPPQWLNSEDIGKSKILDFAAASNSVSVHNPLRREASKPEASSQVPDSLKCLPPRSSGPGSMNFLHFSRPAAIMKSNLQSNDRLKSNEMASTSTSNPLGSTIIEPFGGMKSISGRKSSAVSGKAETKPTSQPSVKLISTYNAEAKNRKEPLLERNLGTKYNKGLPVNIHTPKLDSAVNPENVRNDIEKVPGPAIVSSSVCSGNGVGLTFNNPKNGTKRKIQEGEESECQSEDIEDESVCVKKPVVARGTTAKRTRAAEVHNSSERRRRDRINEKMRALQELIPNCNKVDKASMLDEAIEYLKALQLQLQMMSMGSRMCIPPMMLSPGMQPLRPPHMAHYAHMGMGMGMGFGMGFGMGMLDMSGSLIPHVHRPQGLPGIPMTNNLSMYGMPGQGQAVMTHGIPLVPQPMQLTRVHSAPELPRVDQAAKAKEQQAAQKVETTKDYFEESSSVQINNQMSNSTNEDINSLSGNGNSSSGTSCS